MARTKVPPAVASDETVCQSATGSQGRGACKASPVPHPPFNPYVRFSSKCIPYRMSPTWKEWRWEFVHPIAAWKMSCNLSKRMHPGTRSCRQISGRMSCKVIRSCKVLCPGGVGTSSKYRCWPCPMLGRMSQAQEQYRQTAEAFDTRVLAAPADKWDAQSPCAEWTARDVVAHIVDNHRRLIAEVGGAESKPMTADEDPKEAWTSVYTTMRELTSDPEVMARSVEGPIGPMPLEQMIPQFMCMDILVHTWDLARAVGGDERLDEQSVRGSYEALKPVDAMIRQPNVFGPKLDPPAEADLQTEFLYFLGRRA